MARSKVTIEDIREDFEAARHALGADAKLMPMADDESQVVLALGERCSTHSCAQLQKNLRFLVTVMPGPEAQAAAAE